MGLLERRLELPQPLLHRWIRTGQVRLNGKRTQPFARVSAGDAVRLPPFAGTLSTQARVSQERQQERQTISRQGVTQVRVGSRPPTSHSPHSARHPLRTVEIVAEDEDFMAVFKPAGLPAHPGTGHVDALSTRLAHMADGAAFAPTPVHRLDRDTTGVILVARTYAALRMAHDAIRARSGLHKEYLVWVKGIWPHDGDITLRHYLSKGLVRGRERMIASSRPDQGQEAVLVARCLKRLRDASLLQVRLLTGRTHQIRVQLSTAGFPVLGDGKYGTPSPDHSLYLHSLRLVLADGRIYEALPRWPDPFAVAELPPPLTDLPDDASVTQQP
ncbi:MAG: RluA family pseudouridine synthase [Desulfovibrionaceae bacterium]|nr:RluA family pseudouridine synthase [Desulfovibrionaceae bacterium]